MGTERGVSGALRVEAAQGCPIRPYRFSLNLSGAFHVADNFSMGAGDIAASGFNFIVDGVKYRAERPTIETLARIEDRIADEVLEQAERLLKSAKTDAARARAGAAIKRAESAIVEEGAHKVGNRLWGKILSNPAELAVNLLWSCLAVRSEAERPDLKAVRRIMEVGGNDLSLARAISGVSGFFLDAVEAATGRTMTPELRTKLAKAMAEAEIEIAAEESRKQTRGIPSSTP